MFDFIKEKFIQAKRALTRTGKIREENIKEAIELVKEALIEADVNYEIVDKLIEDIKNKSLNSPVPVGVSPSEYFISIVYKELIELLKPNTALLPDKLPNNRLNKIVLIGLNGSGKTTTAVKLAKKLEGLKPVLIGADPYRPAAYEQLKQMGEKYNIDVYPEPPDKRLDKFLKKAISYAEDEEYTLAIIDTAGRTELNEDLLKELQLVKKSVKPHYTFIVIDSTIGQIAAEIARKFNERIPVTGAIFTKVDTDARGGGILSLKYVCGISIFFLTTGEHIDAIEKFNPDSVARRILGMGDIISLVEKVEKIAKESKKEKLRDIIDGLDLNTFFYYLKSTLTGDMLSSIGDAFGINLSGENVDRMEKEVKKIEAIINSMTPEERSYPEIIDLKRKMRIAKGSGTRIEDVTRLLNNFFVFRKMLKKMHRKGRIFPGMELLMQRR